MIQENDHKMANALNKGEEYWTFKEDANRDYVHSLFAYPAMMVPQMQREILEIFDDNILTEGDFTIFDPFMGSGTVIVEAMLRGYENIIGIDINPLAYLVAKVKTRIYSLPRLKIAIKRLINLIEDTKDVEITTEFFNIEKWFKQDVIRGLEIIKQQIRKEECLKFRQFMWVAFCDTVRIVSNARSCTYKLYIKTDKAIENFNSDPIKVFKNCIKSAYAAIQSFQEELEKRGRLRKTKTRIAYNGKIDLRLADSISASQSVCEKYAPNLIMTSPPYGDNETTVTYGQYSVLELEWIDLDDIKDGIDHTLIETQSKIDRISLGGKINQTICQEYRMRLAERSPTLAEQICTIEEKDRSKIWKILSFYHDFELVLASFDALPSNSYVIMTVGNRTVAKTRISMDEIINEILHYYDFEQTFKFDRRIIRKRMSPVHEIDQQTGAHLESMNKEYVLILKRR